MEVEPIYHFCRISVIPSIAVAPAVEIVSCSVGLCLLNSRQQTDGEPFSAEFNLWASQKYPANS